MFLSDIWIRHCSISPEIEMILSERGQRTQCCFSPPPPWVATQGYRFPLPSLACWHFYHNWFLSSFWRLIEAKSQHWKRSLWLNFPVPFKKGFYLVQKKANLFCTTNFRRLILCFLPRNKEQNPSFSFPPHFILETMRWGRWWFVQADLEDVLLPARSCLCDFLGASLWLL